MVNESREMRRDGLVTPGKVIRFTTMIVVLGLAVHIILPQLASLQHSYQVLRGMAAWIVVLAAVAQVLSYIGNGYLIAAIVRVRNGKLSVFWGTVITLASASLGLVIGGLVGSTTSTYVWIRDKGGDSQGALLGSTLPYLFNNALLLFVAMFGMLHLLLLHNLTTMQGISFILLLLMILLAIGLGSWGIRHPQRSGELAERAAVWILRRFHRHFDPAEFREYVLSLIQSWKIIRAGGWQRPLIGSLMNVGFDILTLYALFIAAGNPISPEVLLTGYGVPYLLGRMAFIIPGGIGIVEGSMTALFTGLGVPYPVAVTVVLSYRAISFWFPVLIGFLLLLVLHPVSGTNTSVQAE
jgi:uncharacterized protein (TIRG00374 family)